MLDIRQIRYEITAARPLKLHQAVPTITLRGAFGYALAQVIARRAGIRHLRDQVELYKSIFMPHNSGEVPLHDEDLARPFVLRGTFSRPDHRSFILDVFIFGQKENAEFFFDEVLRVMAHMGLGFPIQRCEIEKLCSHTVPLQEKPVDSSFLLVRFLTPCSRLKAHGSVFYDEIPFYALFARLVDRVDSLEILYGDGLSPTTSDDKGMLKNAAKEIAWRKLSGGQFTVTRISRRTEDLIKMDGFVGEMLYHGDFVPFFPYLRYLPVINVGRFNVFGCGWCEVEYLNEEPL